MTDEFDDAIRSRLHGAEPVPTGTASAVLGELRPAMRRARLKRTLTVGTATLSLIALTGVGVAAVVNSTAQEPAEIDILDNGDTLPETGSTPTTSDPSDGGQRTSTTVETPATTVEATSSTTPTTTEPAMNAPITVDQTQSNESVEPDDNTSSPASSAPPATASSTPTTTPEVPDPVPTTTPIAPTDSVAPATTSPAPSVPTTAAPSSSQPPVTDPPPSSGQQSIQSSCGSITVSYVGGDVSLVGTQPAGGFSHEVKDSGPDRVEVEFEADEAECEIRAWIDDGVLRTEVDND